jgi:hypothetical protein
MKTMNLNSTKFLFVLSIVAIIVINPFSSIGQLNPISPSSASTSIAAGVNSVNLGNDMFTGKLNFSIPLFNYSAQEIELPIELSYTGGNGIKVDQLPSWVGLGWNLSCGGFVHRKIRGKPDEFLDFRTISRAVTDVWGFSHRTKATYLSPVDYSYFTNKSKLNVANWFSQNFAIANSRPSKDWDRYEYYDGYTLEYVRHHETGNNHYYDLVPDEFTFSVGKLSGKFYLNSQNKWIVLASDNRQYDIEVNIGSMSEYGYSEVARVIKSFIITSPEGIKYHFGNTAPNQVFGQTYYDVSQSSHIYTEIFNFRILPPTPDIRQAGFTGPMYVNSVPHTWHLTKIVNTRTNFVVSLTYKTTGLQASPTNQSWGEGASNPISGYNKLVYDNESQYDQDIPYTSSPVILTAFSKVVTRPWTLESINTSDGLKIQFNSTISTQLGSDQHINGGGNAGIYRYEHFALYPSPNGGLNNLMQLNSIKVTFNEKPKKEIVFGYANSISNRLQLFTISERNSLGVYSPGYIFIYDNNNTGSGLPSYGSRKTDHWGYYNGSDFFSLPASSPPYTLQNTFSKLAGYKTARESGPFYAQMEMLTQVIYPSWGSVKFEYEMNSYNKIRNVSDFSISTIPIETATGGARLKKIKYYNLNNIFEYEKSYQYHNYLQPNNSSGVLSNPAPEYLCGNSSNWKFQSSGYSAVEPNDYHVTYTYVTEKITGLGKTVYEFTNFDNGFNDQKATQSFGRDPNGCLIMGMGANYALQNVEDPQGIGLKYGSSFFKRGKPISVSVFDESNVLKKKTKYTYEHDEPEMSKDELKSVYVGEYWGSQNPFASFSQKLYPNPVKSKEAIDILGSSSIVTKENYVYDGFGNIKEVTSTNSKGEILKKKKKYAYEYTFNANYSSFDEFTNGIRSLKNHKLNSYVIEEIETKSDLNGQNAVVISGRLFTYKEQLNFFGLTGLPALTKVFYLNLKTPILASQFVESSISINNIFIKDINYSPMPDVSYDSYNWAGYPTQVRERKSEPVVFKYSKAQKENKIATISNASETEIAFSSFEETDYPMVGGPTVFTDWFIINGAPSQIQTNLFAPTGEKVLLLNSENGLEANCTLEPLKNYRITYWTNSVSPFLITGVSNNSSTAIKIINGWTCFEHIVSLNQSTVNSIKLYGNGLIDEVRLSPKDAKMTTATFNPFVGITSQCDENNKITYYEYDNFNRLSLIRDQDKNIVKKICYNYAGLQEDCPQGVNTAPQWRPTGQTRCVPCPTNPSQNSGVQEIEEIDVNPNSATHSSPPRWVVNPNGSCPRPPADYQPRMDLGTCELINGAQTGNFIAPTQDVNPCSDSYMQPGPTQVIPNYGPCIPCPTTCTGPQSICINGVCYQGVLKVVRVQRISKTLWECTRAYCFDFNGTIGQTIYTLPANTTYFETFTSPTACPIECFY